MSRRRRDALYAGAVGRKTLADAVRAGRRAAVQSKVDGTYCVATVDHRGYLANLITRNGQSLPEEFVASFRGVRWAPSSVVVGEAEAWTERANRISATRGYPLIHLFDVLRVEGRDVSGLPYHQRRDALRRAESALVNETTDRPWTEDVHGNAHDSAGRWTRRVPMAWRRMPVLEQRPASAAESAWADWVVREGHEGLVLVDLDAGLGRGKSKIKAVDTLDARVVSVGATGIYVVYGNEGFRVACRRFIDQVQVGDTVEISCHGFMEARPIPRHARVVRVRHDLRPAPAAASPTR